MGRLKVTFKTMTTAKEWKFLDRSDVETIVPIINSTEEIYSFSNDNTIIQACNLEFYGNDVRLLRVTKPDWRAGEDALWYIDMGDDHIINLDGSVAAIHEANALTSFRPTPEVLKDYLKFRLFFEIKDNSRTILVDDVAELDLAQEKNIKRIEAYITPIQLKRNDADEITVSVTTHFNNHLYRTDYDINKQGVVTEKSTLRLPLNVKTAQVAKFTP